MTCVCERFETNSPAGISLDYYALKFILNFGVLKQNEFVDQLKCYDCGTNWLLDKTSTNRFAYKLYSLNQFQLLTEWFSHDRTARRFKNVLSKIGYFEDREIEIPCNVVLKNGIKLENCILFKTPFHPKITWFELPIKNILYIDEVEIIAESDYAINFQHREKLNNASELSNSFAPVNLMIDEDIYFRYEGRTKFLNNFFKSDSLKGEDIISTNQNITKYNNPLAHENLQKTISLILCDII